MRVTLFSILLFSLAACTSIRSGKLKYRHVEHQSKVVVESNQYDNTYENELPLEVASVHNNPIVLDTKRIIEFDAPPVECDTLYIRQKEAIAVNVIEITADLIKYRKCESVDGPLYNISKKQVERIKYKDGLVEKFVIIQEETSNDEPYAENVQTEQKSRNGLFHPDRDRTDDGKRATWMIVLGIILLVVGFALLWQASLVTLGCAGEIFTMIGFIVGGALAGAGGVVLMVFGIILLSLKARYAPNSK